MRERLLGIRVKSLPVSQLERQVVLGYFGNYVEGLLKLFSSFVILLTVFFIEAKESLVAQKQIGTRNKEVKPKLVHKRRKKTTRAPRFQMDTNITNYPPTGAREVFRIAKKRGGR